MRLPTRDQVRYHGIRWGWVVFLAALAYAAFPSSATNVAPLLEPGAVAEHDVIAPFTFPVNKSDEELAREAEELAGTVKPIYQFQDRALDSVRAAVRTFFSALETAVTIQRGLRGRSWAEDLDVRVRVGIHSGYPTLDDANYIGMPVHTTARICAAAHGGQILVSGDTREAARGSTPDGVRFRSLGEHRLRGLPDPVPLFQVAAKELVSRFPLPRTLSTD